jgi:hypothetical protein
LVTRSATLALVDWSTLVAVTTTGSWVPAVNVGTWTVALLLAVTWTLASPLLRSWAVIWMNWWPAVVPEPVSWQSGPVVTWK